jgi:hypothetical protein
MTALYELAAQYRSAADQLSDLDLPPEVVADTLESLSGELEEKAQSVAYMIRNLEVTADAIKAFEVAQAERRKAIERRAESLREYIKRSMEACGITKIEGPGITLSFRKSSAVVIDEPALIPAEFMRQPEPPPPAPDKKSIGDALKAGKEVAGAHVEHRQSLQIK